MNTAFKSIAFFSLFLLIGVGCTKVSPQKSINHDTNSEQTDNMAVSENGATLVAGRYEIYNGQQSITHAATKDVVLFFHASWCPTCRALEKDINKKIVPEGLTILKTNYDTEKALKKKYGVTFQHTFVQVDANGNMIKKWSGGNTLESVVAQIK